MYIHTFIIYVHVYMYVTIEGEGPLILRKLLSERNAHGEEHRGTGQDGLPDISRLTKN